MNVTRTLDEPGLEYQTVAAVGGIRALIVCECGRMLFSEFRADAEPDAQLADDGMGLLESLAVPSHLVCWSCGTIWHMGESD